MPVGQQHFPISISNLQTNAFWDGVREPQSECLGLATMVGHDKKVLSILPFGGMGLMSQKAASVDQADEFETAEGYEAEITSYEYHAQIPYDGLVWGTMGDQQQSMQFKGAGISLQETLSYIVDAWFANAWTTSLTGDGKAAIADDHLRRDGGVGDNDMGTAALDAANVWAGIAMHRNLPTDRGLKSRSRSVHLVTNLKNHKTAWEVVGPNAPGATKNNVVFEKTKITPVVCDELGDTEWMLTSAPQFGGLTIVRVPLFEGKAVAIMLVHDPITNKTTIIMHMTVGIGLGTWRWLLGAKTA